MLRRDTNSYQYTGRENDSTGLYYYRARYYDYTAQRFVSEDPIEFKGGSPNLYAYVGNNPMRLIDPYGLAGIEWRTDNGGPEHPVDPATGKQVPLRCESKDTCPEILEKIQNLERTILSHVLWVRQNPGRNDHREDIAGLTCAMAKCIELLNRKDCTKCEGMPKLFPTPNPQLVGAAGSSAMMAILFREMYRAAYGD